MTHRHFRDLNGPLLSAWTNRIENDEGAWQGSGFGITFPDDTTSD